MTPEPLPTAPADLSPEDLDRFYLGLAIEQARIGWEEGGVPIGAALVHGSEVLAVGRNRRVQLGSAIRHGETDALPCIGDGVRQGAGDVETAETAPHDHHTVLPGHRPAPSVHTGAGPSGPASASSFLYSAIVSSPGG